MKTESGFFLDGKYPFVKCGVGPEKIVIFPPTRDLISSLALNPKAEAKTYQRMLPASLNSTIYILGYDINVSADQWCRDIAKDFAIFVKETVGPATIIGISYGGAIAIPFAQQNPELTNKLLLIVSAYGLSDSGVDLVRKLIRIAEDKGLYAVQNQIDNLIKNDFIRFLLKVVHFFEWKIQKKPVNSKTTFINAYTHSSNYPLDLKPHLEGIRAPTLIVGGDQDQFFSIDRYKETAKLIPNAALHLIKNAGHPAPLEKVGQVKKVVHRFLMK